jgi:membrane protein implicated in regulation of membrane protease activity
MQWWSWIAVGVVLLGAELTFVNAQFYLVFIGGASLLVGLLVAAGLGLAPWLQWIIFIVTSLICLLGFRGRLYQRLRGRLPDFRDGLSGEIVHVPVDLEPGAECRLEYRGSSWDALNAGDVPISAGSSARIKRVEGLKLYLRAQT